MAKADRIKEAYRLGVKRAFGYDTNRITEEELLEEHERSDLAVLRRSAGEPRTYVYDCDRGQGSVMARSLAEARREALADCGRSDPPRNVHLATAEELAFRRAMGGSS